VTAATVVAHSYLSCACLHGLHGECGKAQHGRGEAGSPHCKFCPAVCLCLVCRHDGAPVAVAARAFFRGYPDTGWRSQRVTRLHIIREDGRNPGRQGLCGTGAGQHQLSNPVILDPMPAVPPAGLAWCPPCVGQLAERAGQIAAVAALLAAVGGR
jgi:hypothetical protein